MTNVFSIFDSSGMEQKIVLKYNSIGQMLEYLVVVNCVLNDYYKMYKIYY